MQNQVRPKKRSLTLLAPMAALVLLGMAAYLLLPPEMSFLLLVSAFGTLFLAALTVVAMFVCSCK